MAKRIAYTFASEHYDDIRRLVTDKAWPDTFEQWSEMVWQDIEKLRARGDNVEVPTIHPEQFVAYCNACGIDHMNEALNAFAVVTARKLREGSV